MPGTVRNPQLTPTHFTPLEQVLNGTFSVSRELAGAAKLENNRCQTICAKPVLPPSAITHPRGVQEKGEKSVGSSWAERSFRELCGLSALLPASPQAPPTGRAHSSPPWGEFLSPSSFLPLSDISHSNIKAPVTHLQRVCSSALPCPGLGGLLAGPGPTSFPFPPNPTAVRPWIHGRQGES